MYIALAIAAIVYIAISLGVYGTLTVDGGHRSGGTALAEAAKPALGEAGYWLMAVTALFATAGATNSGHLPGGRAQQGPRRQGAVPSGARRDWGRVSIGLGVMVVGDRVPDGVLRPLGHRVARKRGRAAGLHPRQDRPPPRPRATPEPGSAARPGADHDGHDVRGLRVDDPGGGAGHDDGIGRRSSACRSGSTSCGSGSRTGVRITAGIPTITASPLSTSDRSARPPPRSRSLSRRVVPSSTGRRAARSSEPASGRVEDISRPWPVRRSRQILEGGIPCRNKRHSPRGQSSCQMPV